MKKSLVLFILVAIGYAIFFNGSKHVKSIAWKNVGLYQLRYDLMTKRIQDNLDVTNNPTGSINKVLQRTPVFAKYKVVLNQGIACIEYELKDPIYLIEFYDRRLVCSEKCESLNIEYYSNELDVPIISVFSNYDETLHQVVDEIFKSVKTGISCFNIDSITVSPKENSYIQDEIIISGIMELQDNIELEIRTLLSNYKSVLNRVAPTVEQFLKKTPHKISNDVMKLDMRFSSHVVCYG